MSDLAPPFSRHRLFHITKASLPRLPARKIVLEPELTTARSASAEKDLNELSSLGHFLKGSSATLGFNKVRDSCQVIQQYGHKQTLDGTEEPDEKVCLSKITDALKTVKVDFAELEKELKIFFNSGDSETNED